MLIIYAAIVADVGVLLSIPICVAKSERERLSNNIKESNIKANARFDENNQAYEDLTVMLRDSNQMADELGEIISQWQYDNNRRIGFAYGISINHDKKNLKTRHINLKLLTF